MRSTTCEPELEGQESRAQALGMKKVPRTSKGFPPCRASTMVQDLWIRRVDAMTGRRANALNKVARALLRLWKNLDTSLEAVAARVRSGVLVGLSYCDNMEVVAIADTPVTDPVFHAGVARDREDPEGLRDCTAEDVTRAMAGLARLGLPWREEPPTRATGSAGRLEGRLGQDPSPKARAAPVLPERPCARLPIQ